MDGGSKRTAEGAQQRGLQQILEVKPEDKVETLPCGQRESGERILEEAREWDGVEKWVVKERSGGARSCRQHLTPGYNLSFANMLKIP